MSNYNFIWKPLNRASLEIDTNHIAKGESDGRKNLPKSDQKKFSINESEIFNQSLDPINEQINEAKIVLQNKENNLTKISQDIRQDSFHSIAPELNTVTASSLTTFKQKIVNQYHEWHSYKNEYQTFKTVNRLRRPAASKSFLMSMASLLLIVGLVSFEIYVNTSFLGSALPGGRNEGMALSMSVAFINVFLSFLIGMGVMRNLNHCKKNRRISFGLVLSLYVLLFTFVNFALGIFRTAAAKDILISYGDVTVEQMTAWGAVAVRPWANLGILDVSGWTLVIMGMSFAIISLFDGYFFSDTYPGYGKVGQKLSNSADKYLSIKSNFEKEGKKNYELAIKLAQDRMREDSNNRQIWNDEINSFQNIFLSYESMSKNWEIDIDHIIQEYRQYNSMRRTTPDPEYFSEKFTLSTDMVSAEKKFTAQYDSYMTDKEREIQSLKLVELNQSQYDESLKEINEVFSKYNINLNNIVNEYTIY